MLNRECIEGFICKAAKLIWVHVVVSLYLKLANQSFFLSHLSTPFQALAIETSRDVALYPSNRGMTVLLIKKEYYRRKMTIATVESCFYQKVLPPAECPHPAHLHHQHGQLSGSAELFPFPFSTPPLLLCPLYHLPALSPYFSFFCLLSFYIILSFCPSILFHVIFGRSLPHLNLHCHGTF